MSLMLDEIRQQPEVLEGLLREPPEGLASLRRRFATARPEAIIIVARGTSDHAALFCRYFYEIVLGIPTFLAAPSNVTLYHRFALPCNALVLGISQSGESTDVNAYVEAARDRGAFTVGVTNEGSGSLTQLADETLLIAAGKESSVAATKTYTAELMTLYLLAVALGAPLRNEDLAAVSETVAEALRDEPAARDLAHACSEMTHAVVLGRGLSYANSLEFALKMMETSYIVASGFSAADFAHGPIAMIEEDFRVFAFTPSGPTADQSEILVRRLADRGAETICIGPDAVVGGLPCSSAVRVEIPVANAEGLPVDSLAPIPSIVPAQLFAAYLAESKGLNPDQPRNLSKVTRTM